MKETVRSVVFAFAFLAVATASAANFAPTLPQVEFLDTEVATNVAISDVSQEARRYAFSLSFVGSASNNVEIAFGTDTDGDGALSDEEVEFSAGWDCGEWFTSNAITGERLVAEGADGSHEFVGGVYLRADGRVRAAVFRNGVASLFPALAAAAKLWSFPATWNMVRLVGRGENIRSGERFYIFATVPGFAIRLQ